MGNKKLFMAEIRENEPSFINRTMMGLLLGLALGWVLLRYRKPTVTGKTNIQGGSADREIEIPVSGEDEPPEDQDAVRPGSASPDRLEAIKGIGPVFAKRLNTAGVFTYRDLASREPEQLIEIVKARPGQIGEIKEWIEQAKMLYNDAG